MRYGATILLSAFLLFQVQPLVAKTILPWFGGSPSVWIHCMLFFQVVLVVGYAYAHVLSSRLTPRAQAIVHGALLVLAVATLPILPGEGWKPTGDESPSLRILMMLTVCIGPPYLLLSATGPLLQRWFAMTADRSPYRLYALSNAGSVAALVTFPFVFEPLLSISTMNRVWSVSFVGFAVLCGATAWRTAAVAPRSTGPPVVWRVPPRRIAAWLGLAALPSVMLLATTNVLCQDVASVPFLWVAPLTVYLITFILCFDSDRRYRREVFAPLLGVAAVVAIIVAHLVDRNVGGILLGLPALIAVYLTLLFAAGMVCHGELAASRPDPAGLTAFYLAVAAGGALGGVFVAGIAPRVFDSYAELWLGALACVGVADHALIRAIRSRRVRLPVVAVMTVAAVAAAALHAVDREGKELMTERGFFGRLGIRERVIDETEDGVTTGVHIRAMRHGRILHGLQIQDAKRRRTPTAYFGPAGGGGLAMRLARRTAHPDRPDAPVRVGLVGLGVGTLVTYAERGDQVRIYELQPEVVDAADRYFTYLADARERGVDVQIVVGDARIHLEREAPQRFDVLIVDAFSSDAVPQHLLTLECGDVYRKHVAPDGLLAIHITNQYLDLYPVVSALASHLRTRSVRLVNAADEGGIVRRAVWIVITNNAAFLRAPEVRRSAVARAVEPEPCPWTDDFSSLWHVLRWRRRVG